MSRACSLPGTQGSFNVSGKSHASRNIRIKPSLVSRGTVSGFAVSSWTFPLSVTLFPPGDRETWLETAEAGLELSLDPSV